MVWMKGSDSSEWMGYMADIPGRFHSANPAIKLGGFMFPNGSSRLVANCMEDYRFGLFCKMLVEDNVEIVFYLRMLKTLICQNII